VPDTVQTRHQDTRCATDVARTLRTIAIIAAFAVLVWALSDIVLLIFLAVVIAVILRGLGDWAARHTGASQHAMLALVSILIAAALLGLAYYMGPKLMSESQDLLSRLRQGMDHLRVAYGNTAWGRVIFENLSPPQEVKDHIASYAGTVASTTVGGLVTVFILLVTALYFAIAPELYIAGTVRLFPLRYRPRARAIFIDVGRTLQWWSLGQLIDMVVVGVLSGIGLLLLGVPLALALGVLAGLFTFVPYFGAIAAAIPAMLVALTVSWQTSLWVALIFLVCHGIEGYLISPLVQRNTADLPPALTILSMTVLGTLFGTFGIILGTPVAAALLVIVREAYVGDVLGDSEAANSRVESVAE
jgi:predicted PurR-regulated permease PerM